MQNDSLLAIHVDHRFSHVPPLQKILTEYGCHIRTRIGLHATGESGCSEDGIIILHLDTGSTAAHELQQKLNNVDGIRAKFIEFDG